MGGYGPMIAGTMAQQGATDIARQRQLADEQRQQNNALDLGVINNPAADPQAKADAYNRMNARYPVGSHVQFFQDLFHPLRAAHQHAQAAQAQSQASVATNTPPVSDNSSPPPTVTNPAAVLQGAAPATAAPQAPAQPPAAAAPAAPLAQVQAVGRAQTPDQALSIMRGYASPAQAQNTLAQQMQEAMARREQEIAQTRGQYGIQEAIIRAQGNVAMKKLDAAAQSLGADDFSSASPEIKMQAMTAMHTANVTPSWKSVQDGNNIYAIDAHNPNGQRTLIGHKDDLTSHTEYKTLQNADGSTYLVPLTTWTKKGSSVPVAQTQDEQPSAQGAPAPVSGNTPAGPMSGASTPPNNGEVSSTAPPLSASSSAVNAKLNKKKPQSNQLPVSAATPGGPPLPKGAVPFGSKGSPLLKSDTQQYTKFAEDANTKQLSWQNAQEAAQNPTPTSDQELIYSWVRSNVQGAGRMTQAEFKQAGGVGSVPTKIENWASLATTGKLTPEIRQFMLRDIQMGARNSQKLADTYRQRVQDEMQGKPPSTSPLPVSTQTPAGPSGNFDWNSAPVHK